MWTCQICHFEVTRDDCVAPTGTGRCICLRCYCRETVTDRPMPAALRREIARALAEIEVGT